MQAQLVCLQYRHEHSWDSWFDALLRILQSNVGSEARGRLGPHWVRYHSLRVRVGSPGVQSAYIHAIPGGLWEVFIGVWLIVKGFNPSAFVSDSDKTDIGESDKEKELESYQEPETDQIWRSPAWLAGLRQL